MKKTWLLSTICSVAIMGGASAAMAQTTTPAPAPSAMAPMSSGSMGMKPMHHKKWMHKGKMGPSDADHSADMLNAKELQSPMASPMSAPMSPPAMAPAPMAPMAPAPMAPATTSP